MLYFSLLLYYYPGVGEFYPVAYNHMDICKPENKKSILFRYLPTYFLGAMGNFIFNKAFKSQCLLVIFKGPA